MIQIVKGDLLLSDANVLVHQVNCKGVMGAGIASQIRNRYPEVFRAYALLCHEYKYSQYLLPGKTQLVEVEVGGRCVAKKMGCCPICGEFKLALYVKKSNKCLVRLLLLGIIQLVLRGYWSIMKKDANCLRVTPIHDAYLENGT